MSRYPMTKEGESFLRKELRKLKSEDRRRVVEAIAEAREFGDLKENAEYHTAKDLQGMIESRIREIETKLAGAQVIDVTQIQPLGKVVFGATVGLQDLGESKSISYKIVGEDEADVNSGKISVNSPLSRSLVGKSKGDFFKLETPSGTKKYEVLSIKYI